MCSSGLKCAQTASNWIAYQFYNYSCFYVNNMKLVMYSNTYLNL